MASGVAGVITTSLVTGANAACSALMTYRPRAGRVSVKDPSGAVAVATFFPVSVLEAVTVTPGRGVLPDVTLPRTVNVVASGLDNTAAAGLALTESGAAGAVCPTATLLAQQESPNPQTSAVTSARFMRVVIYNYFGVCCGEAC